MTTANDPSQQAPWKVAICVSLATAIVPAIFTNLDKVAALFPASDQSSAESAAAPQNQAPASASASDKDLLYYVIAAESKYPESLRKLPAQAAGLEFARSFPNIKMCPSKVDPETYYLVLGSKLSQSDAKSLRQQAIVNNFDRETYIQSDKQIFFVPSNCSQVTAST
ncbi:MAG: hypothetical protein NW220_15500 [Leptolyngbyaceae cyanobacterium bins.349]|nr:hypothetical protein [Leptolyngbyaceae cyanobacterium bins.349]